MKKRQNYNCYSKNRSKNRKKSKKSISQIHKIDQYQDYKNLKIFHNKNNWIQINNKSKIIDQTQKSYQNHLKLIALI